MLCLMVDKRNKFLFNYVRFEFSKYGLFIFLVVLRRYLVISVFVERFCVIVGGGVFLLRG